MSADQHSAFEALAADFERETGLKAPTVADRDAPDYAKRWQAWVWWRRRTRWAQWRRRP